MIKFLDGEDYPPDENKFPLFFQGPFGISRIINKMFPQCEIFVKYTDPDVGKIYFNSWRSREFICNIIPEKYFMCFASYDGETLPPYTGDFNVIEFCKNGRKTPRTFDKRKLKNE
jgi:hypothetical protein